MSEQETSAAARIRAQVEDALELANFVVSTGAKARDGSPLATADIAVIHATAAAIGLLNVSLPADAGGAPKGSITKDQWIAFEEAYYHLSSATSPVTAETLLATRTLPDGANDTAKFPGIIQGKSPAHQFARRFLFLSIGVALCVFALELASHIFGMKTDQQAVDTWKYAVDFLLPWLYGALGACAYLLRSAHYFIYQRTFDMRRTPEYTNRIILGSISGGAIILFSNYLAAEDDTFTHFGSAALGFIAGYSTDLLFNTVERIVTAIFPKVAVETVPRDSSQQSLLHRNRRSPPPPGPADQDNKQDNKPDAKKREPHRQHDE